MRALSKPVSQVYTEARLRELLSNAEANAAADWDCTFVSDMASRFKHYGMSMRISTLQRHHLERIAKQ